MGDQVRELLAAVGPLVEALKRGLGQLLQDEGQQENLMAGPALRVREWRTIVEVWERLASGAGWLCLAGPKCMWGEVVESYNRLTEGEGRGPGRCELCQKEIDGWPYVEKVWPGVERQLWHTYCFVAMHQGVLDVGPAAVGFEEVQAVLAEGRLRSGVAVVAKAILARWPGEVTGGTSEAAAEGTGETEAV